MGVSVICIVIGIYMLWDNGVDAYMAFSQVFVSTRIRQDLSGCRDGRRLKISDDLNITQLRFGILQTGGSHPCFGVKNEIIPLKSKKR